MLSGIILTLFLVALNGFFVAAEFAIVKVRSSKLKLAADAGRPMARTALHIVNNLDAYLSACQLGITLSSLGLGWIGEGVVAELLIETFAALGFNLSGPLAHSIAIPIAFSMITLLHIVYGELAPKSLAIRYSERMSLAIALPLHGFYVVFRPIIALFNGLANLSLKLVGLAPVSGHEGHSEEELRLLLRQSREGGQLPSEEYLLLDRVFRFNDRVVRQVLVPRTRMIAVEENTPPQEQLKRILAEGYSRLPVYEETRDRIVGVVHAKDVLRAVNDPGFALRAALHPPFFVPESMPLRTLLREMQQRKAQMAIVVDEYGSTAGIVTMEDVIEELVGEIQDEYDEEPPPVLRVSEREFLVEATAAISDINLLLPQPFPDDQGWDSLGGLLQKLAEGVPNPDQQFRFGPYLLTALDVNPKSVRRVRVALAPEPTADTAEVSSG